MATSTLDVLEHYNTTLAGLQGDAMVQFLLRTAHIVRDFIDARAEASQQQAPRAFVRTKRGPTACDRLQQKYFQAVGITLPHQVQSSTSDRQHLEATTCCATPEILLLVEYAVCGSCGRKVEDSNQYVQSVGDGTTNGAVNRVMNIVDTVEDTTTSNKTALVNRSLLRLQGLRISAFKEHEWRRLYNNVTAGIDDVCTMSPQMVNRKLAPSDKKYAKDIYVIWEKITGQPLMPLSDALQWFINHKVANQLIIPVTTNKQGVSKPPRILAMTLLYKCFQLCGEKRLMNLIVMQHADASMASFEPIWRLTCQTHGFKYMA